MKKNEYPTFMEMWDENKRLTDIAIDKAYWAGKYHGYADALEDFGRKDDSDFEEILSEIGKELTKEE